MIRAAMKLLKRHRRRILASVGILLSVATMAFGIWVFKPWYWASCFMEFAMAFQVS
jgi:hypothetical protein